MSSKKNSVSKGYLLETYETNNFFTILQNKYEDIDSEEVDSCLSVSKRGLTYQSMRKKNEKAEPVEMDGSSSKKIKVEYDLRNFEHVISFSILTDNYEESLSAVLKRYELLNKSRKYL